MVTRLVRVRNVFRLLADDAPLKPDVVLLPLPSLNQDLTPEGDEDREDDVPSGVETPRDELVDAEGHSQEGWQSEHRWEEVKEGVLHAPLFAKVVLESIEVPELAALIEVLGEVALVDSELKRKVIGNA